MSHAHDTDALPLAAREKMRSVWLVIFMAIVPSALRIAIRAANEITLWRVYGRARVAAEHLRITKIKPQLVVSNGDVLRGQGFSHYLISAGIWLPLAVGLLFLIYYTLLPKPHREVWLRKEQSVSIVGLVWGLALFFLSVGLAPLGVSLAVSLASVAAALIWARRMQEAVAGQTL